LFVGKAVEKAQKTEPSKQNVLSLLTCIFDPLGLLSPTCAKAKILFQDICISGLDWDDILGRSLKNRWENCLKDFSKANAVTVERYVSQWETSSISTAEAKYWLHGFGVSTFEMFKKIHR
jgi:metal-sulfur cluster biosynthetic enzyme